jgi:hypothetical protein
MAFFSSGSMISKQFPYNPVISLVEYNASAQELIIHYKKAGIRHYAEVQKEIFYGLFYLNDAKLLLAYWRKNIRKKYKLLTIINQKPK